MTRQQAIEKAAKERAANKDQATLQGQIAPQAKDQTDTSSLTRIPSERIADPSEGVADLSRFADALDGLLETLREAANYGPTCELQGKFDALREELKGDYLALRPLLAQFEEPLGPPTALGFDFHRMWSDPIERLLRPETLEEALRTSIRSTSSDALRAGQILNRCWKSMSGQDSKSTSALQHLDEKAPSAVDANILKDNFQ